MLKVQCRKLIIKNLFPYNLLLFCMINLAYSSPVFCFDMNIYINILLLKHISTESLFPLAWNGHTALNFYFYITHCYNQSLKCSSPVPISNYMYEQQTSGLEIFKGAVVGKSTLFPSSHHSFSDALCKASFCSITSNNTDNYLSLMEHLK